MYKTALLLSLMAMFSCSDKEAEQLERIENTVKTHVTEKTREIDPTVKVDSVRIIDIDTVSSKMQLKIAIAENELAFDKENGIANLEVEQLKLNIEQYKILKSLGSSKSTLEILEGEIMEGQKKSEEKISQLKALDAKIKALNDKYLSNAVDSTNFLFYRVVFKACFTNKSLEQKCIDSGQVFITKDFRVKLKALD